MRIALIANPRSGGKNSEKRIDPIIRAFKSAGFGIALFVSRHHGHVMEIMRDIDPARFDAIIAMGGDGTNYQVLNGLLKYHPYESVPPLGIIPLGRGNSFARDLPIRTVRESINAVIRKSTRPVDVCTFTQNDEIYYFVNLLGIGFVTDVARTASRYPLAGDLSYVIGVFHRVIRLPFHRMHLEIDGETIVQRNCFIEICNSRYTGGAMLMAPDARIDDGWFDVVILGPLTRWSLLKTFPKIFKGTHGENPAVRFARGKRAKIITTPEKNMLPDGECFGTTETTIGILPGHVRYFC